MPHPTGSLEYEEEDLFGSDDDSAALQSALLTSSSAIRPIPSNSLGARPSESCAEKRLAEIRDRKRELGEEVQGNGKGVDTLKSFCLTGESSDKASRSTLSKTVRRSDPSQLVPDMGYRRDGVPPHPLIPGRATYGPAI